MLLVIVVQFVIMLPAPKAYAATAPNLGVAAGYSVFGNAGITETPAQTSHLWGNAGGNGFGNASLIASQVDGSIDAGANGPVVSAITSAYGDLAGQGLTGAIDLAASPTVVPGVYDIAATSFNSTLTLNGAGVYIFRSTSSIAQTAGGTMSLINGACASEVYWQIPTSITFAAVGSIEGTIITNTGNITFVSGVSLKGRAWAGTQVTMSNNQITEPATCSSPTPTPTPSPTPTPTPTSSSSSSSSSPSSSDGSSSAGNTAYPVLASTVIAPTILESRRIDADSLFISWGPYSGVDTFNIQYGHENGKWLYNTDTTGFSITINDLPPNQSIYVRVAARNTGMIGNYGEAKFVGGQQVSVINPNVLGVSYPNAGFAPRQNNILRGNPTGVFAGILTLLALIQGRYWFSSKHETLR